MKGRFRVLRNSVYILFTFVLIHITTQAQVSDTIRFKSKGRLAGEIISIGKDTLVMNKSAVQKAIFNKQDRNFKYPGLDRIKLITIDQEIMEYDFIDIDTIFTNKSLNDLPVYYITALMDGKSFFKKYLFFEGLKLYASGSFGYTPQAKFIKGLYGQGLNVNFNAGVLLTRFIGFEFNVTLFRGNNGEKDQVGYMIAPLYVLAIENLFDNITPFFKFGLAKGSVSFYDNNPSPTEMVISREFSSLPYPNLSLVMKESSSTSSFYYIAKAGAKVLKISNTELFFEVTYILSDYLISNNVIRVLYNQSPTQVQDYTTPELISAYNKTYKTTNNKSRESLTIGFNIGLQFSF